MKLDLVVFSPTDKEFRIAQKHHSFINRHKRQALRVILDWNKKREKFNDELLRWFIYDNCFYAPCLKFDSNNENIVKFSDELFIRLFGLSVTIAIEQNLKLGIFKFVNTPDVEQYNNEIDRVLELIKDKHNQVFSSHVVVLNYDMQTRTFVHN